MSESHLTSAESRGQVRLARSADREGRAGVSKPADDRPERAGERPERADGRPERKVGLIVGVLALAVFMSSLDLFIVNLAFPYIGRDYATRRLYVEP